MVLEDLLERMEADTFVGLYSQVRARGLSSGSVSCQHVSSFAQSPPFLA